jgi:hypothetical protein
MFGLRDDASQEWWAWDMVQEMAKTLNIPTVPELYRGTFKTVAELRKATEEIAQQPSLFGGEREGIVVRVAEAFTDETFSQSLAKWVRKNHVQTEDHWTSLNVVPQKLIKLS